MTPSPDSPLRRAARRRRGAGRGVVLIEVLMSLLLLSIAAAGSVGMVLVMVALGLLAQRLPSHRDGTATLLPRSNHDPSATVRLLGAVSLGLSVLLAVLGLAIMGVQRGLDDARDAPDIGPWAALAFALLVGFALLGWFVQPSSPKQEPLDATQHQEPWQGGSAAPLPLPECAASPSWLESSKASMPLLPHPMMQARTASA